MIQESNHHEPLCRTSVTVIFPAYNEEANIRPTIERALDAMASRFQNFELLVIDDHSSDHTGAIAEELAALHPQITVLHNEQNLGLGDTLYRGYQSAKGELVIQNGMDYPLDLCDLPKMIALLDDADIVVAVRTSYAGYSSYRRIASRVNRVLLRMLFHPKLRDYNYTQLFRKRVLTTVHPDSRNTVFLVPEILIRANSLGFRIKEIEIDYHPRLVGEATSGKASVVLHCLSDMFAFWYRMKWSPSRVERTHPI